MIAHLRFFFFPGLTSKITYTGPEETQTNMANNELISDSTTINDRTHSVRNTTHLRHDERQTHASPL